MSKAEPTYRSEDDPYDDGSRWWWLRGNKFYEVTPLTGYLFISQAKTVIEVIFWYVLLIGFTALTIDNVYDSISYYLTRPTQTSVRVESGRRDSNIENFFMHLNISLFEMDSGAPISLESMRQVTDIACLNSDNGATRASVNKHSWKMTTHFNSSSTMEQEMQYISSRSGSAPTSPTWDQWLSKIKGEIDKAYMSHRSAGAKPFWNSIEERDDHMIDHLAELQIAMASGDDTESVVGALILLDIINQGIGPYETSIGLLREQNGNSISDGQELLQKYNIDLENLYKMVEGDLKRYIRVETNIAGSQVFLSNWSGNIENRQQKFTYKLLFPEDISEVQVEIHSRQLAYLLAILESIAKHMEELKKYEAEQDSCATCPEDLYCPNYNLTENWLMPWDYELDIIQKLYMNTFLEFMEFYDDTANMQVEMLSGTVQLRPFYHHEIVLLPTGRFMSETSDCTDENLFHCLSQCSLEIYTSECGCIPWSLYHLRTVEQICVKPCPTGEERVSECDLSCERKLAHPCDRSLYRPESSLIPLKHFDWQMGQPAIIRPDLPLLTFRLYFIEVFHHPKYTEQYKMSVGKLMAELGGLIDFWLGVNVIAVIHLFVYMIRQCKNLVNPNTKTGATARRILRRAAPKIEPRSGPQKRKTTRAGTKFSERKQTVEHMDTATLENLVRKKTETLQRDIKKAQEEAEKRDAHFQARIEHYRKIFDQHSKLAA